MRRQTTLYVYTPRRATRWGEAVALFFRQYTVFSGRSTRSEFWWWSLTNLLIVSLLSFGNGPVAGYAGLVWTMVTLVPTLSLGARRLTDSGLSRVWCVLPYVGGLLTLMVGAGSFLYGLGVSYAPAAFPNFGHISIEAHVPFADSVGLVSLACIFAYVVLMLRQSRSALPNAKVVGPTLRISPDTDADACLQI